MSAHAIAELAATPWALAALFALVLADGLLPPVPGEALLTGLAALAWTTGRPPFALIVPVAVFASIAGDVLAYWLAGRMRLDQWRSLEGPRAQRLIGACRSALGRHAAPFILAVRFIPAGRAASSLAAGALRHPFRPFLALSAVASLAWTAYMCALGIAAGTLLPDNPLIAAGVGIAFGLVLGVVFEAVRRRRVRTAS